MEIQNKHVYLCTSSYTSLIKKGRGKWPDDALATCFAVAEKGANSSPMEYRDR